MFLQPCLCWLWQLVRQCKVRRPSLEHAYDDFKDHPKTGDVLPYNNYPMKIEEGQVFLVELTKKDGAVIRGYYRSDGNRWEGLLTTEEFEIGSDAEIRA